MGMPTEGDVSKETIKDHLRKEVPTCSLDQELDDLKLSGSDDWHICVIINANRIVLGLLDLNTTKITQGTIEDVMKPAPPTLRPSVSVDEALAYFEESKLTFALVTKPTGELMGVIRKADLTG